MQKSYSVVRLIANWPHQFLPFGQLFCPDLVDHITVNRWPHGYAYEYNELYDTNAYAYVDGAIDAADRAVNEQLTAQEKGQHHEEQT